MKRDYEIFFGRHLKRPQPKTMYGKFSTRSVLFLYLTSIDRSLNTLRKGSKLGKGRSNSDGLKITDPLALYPFHLLIDKLRKSLPQFHLQISL